MNLTKKQIDDLNLELTLEIAPEDYQEAVRKKLAERRRTAEFKGFRKGMVPASLIKRVYGEQALV
ncbi:MAG: trigger factor family protein, partial [Bacteroidales bacterium]|nr:trigger factor family protein [Bacteroidales bacterium]